jgi:hypothetical protein
MDKFDSDLPRMRGYNICDNQAFYSPLYKFSNTKIWLM